MAMLEDVKKLAEQSTGIAGKPRDLPGSFARGNRALSDLRTMAPFPPSELAAHPLSRRPAAGDIVRSCGDLRGAVRAERLVGFLAQRRVRLSALPFRYPRGDGRRARFRGRAVRWKARPQAEAQGRRRGHPAGRHRPPALLGERGFFVVGAYPATGKYHLCRTSPKEHERALKTVPKVPPPRRDPVYGRNGALSKLWARTRRTGAKRKKSARRRA